MAKIIKRNDEYYVQFYGNGLLFEKLAGTSKAQAEKMLREIESSLPDGAMSHYVPDQDMESFTRQIKEDFARKYSNITLQEFDKAFTSLKDFCHTAKIKVEKLSHITPKIIEAYQKEMKKTLKADDINYQIFLLKRIFDFAITKAYLNDNPTLHIQPLPSKPPVVLSEDELNKIGKGKSSADELSVQYLLNDAKASERIRLLRWSMITHKKLKHALVAKLLKAKVPLIRLVDIFQVEDIREFKRYTGWEQPQI